MKQIKLITSNWQGGHEIRRNDRYHGGVLEMANPVPRRRKPGIDLIRRPVGCMGGTVMWTAGDPAKTG